MGLPAQVRDVGQRRGLRTGLLAFLGKSHAKEKARVQDRTCSSKSRHDGKVASAII